MSKDDEKSCNRNEKLYLWIFIAHGFCQMNDKSIDTQNLHIYELNLTTKNT